MNLSEICVKRPVFAFMLIFFLVTLGLFSYKDLGLDLFPRTDPATVNVEVRLPGASPEEVAGQVIIPLEEAISAISGISEMRAYIFEGSGRMSIQFVLERDIGEAAEDVREKVSAAMRKLPPNALPPSVTKSDPDSDPIITLAVSGKRSQRELTEIADKIIRRSIETVDGVGGIDVFGGRQRQINVFLEIDKLNAYNLSAQDVDRAIRSENVETPGGRITRGPTELEVRTMGRVEKVADFGNIILKNVGGAPVRIRDIGYAEDGMAERRSFGYHQNKPAVMLEIRRQVGVNTVKVVEDILKRVENVKRNLPSGVEVSIFFFFQILKDLELNFQNIYSHGCKTTMLGK
ncbi:MAG: efflux RND transporter permease subunit [Candidatus Solibacter usitatus]|nr:efflux RND transporter permease subunit [Candidatus Solibacter usitatus]